MSVFASIATAAVVAAWPSGLRVVFEQVAAGLDLLECRGSRKRVATTLLCTPILLRLIVLLLLLLSLKVFQFLFPQRNSSSSSSSGDIILIVHRLLLRAFGRQRNATSLLRALSARGSIALPDAFIHPSVRYSTCQSVTLVHDTDSYFRWR